MADKSNSAYMRCEKSVNELVMRLGNLQYEEINIIISNAGPIHGGSSVESGFEPGTLRPQSRDLTTRPPRPCLVVELRRFVKLNSYKAISPFLITILGTTVPETIKLWFIRQRIQPFVDRPRQCNKCFVYGTRTCDKNNICFCCGGDHIGPCQQPAKCVNCSGSHNAKSRSCPIYIQEQKILELKSHNHITIGEARRVFQQKNAKYAESVKTLPAVSNIEESLNAKFENVLKTINDKFERQMQLFVDMLQKSMNCILQKFFKIFERSVDPSLSRARKKKLLSKFNQITSTLSTWDAGGPSEVEQMSLY
ncbi:hypothetical protein AVEN_68258-1 [Araneus ventricosus]|uniref:Uncharacterized protein n=1 Tax=Araneus ventricosus TaxID=182803 RepID=A0A4Y2SAQ8_ARAVE|nr:hypothetical protein AVEN_68258-1 [Araneus ventricosus]